MDLNIPNHSSPWGYKIVRALVQADSILLIIKKKDGHNGVKVHFVDYDGKTVTKSGHTQHQNGSISSIGQQNYTGYQACILPKMFAIKPSVFNELFELVA